MSASAISPSPRERPDAAPIPIRGGLPPRNPDFTGRWATQNTLCRTLHGSGAANVVPQTLHGLGGVGKTQIALEYVYRHLDEYDLIWWVPAEHPAAVLQSLEELARRLGLPVRADRRRTAAAVRDALATGERRWLLVFDNADNPDELAELVPSAGGHVILTSRDQAWAGHTGLVEVDLFHRRESITLLTRRRIIASQDADRLAEKLGDLPLALDQAASWLAATAMSAAEYLDLLDAHLNELLSEGRPRGYPTTVAAFVGMAHEQLRADRPAAARLLELFAYLGPEPISTELLHRGQRGDVSEPLRDMLRKPIALNRLIRHLCRIGLVRVDSNRGVQVHRLIQHVLRDRIEGMPGLAAECLGNVVAILAAANPGDPDNPAHWPAHAELGPHMAAAGLVNDPSGSARRAVLDQIRYLWASGEYEQSRGLAQEAVDRWTNAPGEGIGPDGEWTLLATRHLATAVRSLGDYETARAITARTLPVLRQVFGDDHEHTLAAASALGADLRIAGRVQLALEHELDNVDRHLNHYSLDDPAALRAQNNVAVSFRQTGDFEAARTIDEHNVEVARQTFGDNDPRTIFYWINLARDLFGLGRYREALLRLESLYPVYRARLGTGHVHVLLAARTLAMTLRKVGAYLAALTRAEANARGLHQRLGADHEHTLASAMTYANTLRAAGRFTAADRVAASACTLYEGKFGRRHGLTLAANANRAIILRRRGHVRDALELNRSVYGAMRETLGDEHPFVLSVAGNLASDLALSHEPAAAHALSEQTLQISRRIRGHAHPDTLACARNAAIDRRAVGDDDGSEDSSPADVLRGWRADCDIEPPPS
ncbi:FxSxx-COOH system tetratricopeptide repeat protein [Dactylosporangium sp. NPDC051541]|uniref:FxSxx-COOH system tetratricopeptide repeat protein n=1 Tax=Dactylosporangium sp. NPDC051541 TaxID=3363977 RepID=UPI0037B6E237